MRFQRNMIKMMFLIICSIFLWFSFSQNTSSNSVKTEPCQNPVPKTKIIAVPIKTNSDKGIAPLASNSFVGFVRVPAEEQTILPMMNNTAYYRDILLGGITNITNAQDGDTFVAKYIFASGLSASLSAVFHSTINGQQNCFVFSDGSTVCNTTNINNLWLIEASCTPQQTIRAEFSSNNVIFYSGQFDMVDRIPPNKVPHFPQYGEPTNPDYQWQNVLYGRTRTKTIHLKGCALCALAELVSYHAQIQRKPIVLPPQLNDSLRNNNAYDASDGIDWMRVPKALEKDFGIILTHLSNRAFQPTDICLRGPQLFHLGVDSGSHWVAVHGQNGPGTAPGNYLANDPGSNLANGGLDRFLSYYAPIGIPIIKTKVFEGPEFQTPIFGSLRVSFHSPGEILITDPQGRRTGFDASTNQSFNEIPFSEYEIAGIDEHNIPEVTPGDAPSEVAKIITVTNPVSGDYVVKVTGTGTGTYTLSMRTYDSRANMTSSEIPDVPITPSTIHQFTFNYALPVIEGNALDVVGGFDGGGQRPRDVNKFLSYANPSSSQVSLPTNTSSVPLLIIYNKSIIPTTFSADLNGTNISSLFNPIPGQTQLINIPLQAGSNVLKLSVDGNLSNRIATDSDRLVFKVQ